MDAPPDVAIQCERELREEIEKLERDIDKLGKLRGEAYSRKWKELKQRIPQLHTLGASLRSEAPDLPPDESERYFELADEHDAAIDKLIKDLEWKRSPTERLDGGTGLNIEELNDKQVLAQAVVVNQESDRRMDGIVQDVRQMNEMADDTLVVMSAQKEQLARTYDRANQLQTDLGEVKRQVRRFGRNAMTDKCFISLAAFIMCCLIVVLIVSFFVPKNDGDGRWG